MTEHNKTCETSNSSSADFDAQRSRLEESLVLDHADWDPEWVNNPDDTTLTFAQRLARAGHFGEDVDNHPMQCHCVECYPPTNESFYTGAIGDRRVVSQNTRPYNVTLKNINPQIVSAVIGKKGAIQKRLVQGYCLKSLRIGEPTDQVLDSGRTVSRCNIVLIGYIRENVMAATKRVVSILKQEEELYIEIDYMDYKTHEKAFI